MFTYDISAVSSRDGDIRPIARLRAMSDSLKDHPKYASIDDVAHVHWADEEHGHALSTSVGIRLADQESLEEGYVIQNLADVVTRRSILKKMSES